MDPQQALGFRVFDIMKSLLSKMKKLKLSERNKAENKRKNKQRKIK